MRSPDREVITAILQLTTFSDTPFKLVGELDRDDPTGLLFVMALGVGVQGLFAQVAHGATVTAVAGILTGKPTTVSAALDSAFTRMGPLLLMALLLVGGFGLLFATLIGIVLVPVFAMRFSLGYEALMIEKLGVVSAFRRSWQLTTGHVFRILGTLILGAFTAIPALVFVFLLSSVVAGSRTQEVIASAVVAVAQAVILAPVYAFFTAVTTTIFFKLKEQPDVRRPV